MSFHNYPLFFVNESNLQYINELGKRGGLKHYVHPDVRPLPEETGEVFFYKYHRKQKLLNKTYEQSQIGQCLCPICPIDDDPISDDDDDGDIEQSIGVDIGKIEPKSVAITATAFIPTTLTGSSAATP